MITKSRSQKINRSAAVLEDEVNPGKAICRTMETLGYSCDRFESIDNAIVELSKHMYDVLLVDVHIDDEIPDEVIREARIKQPGVVVVGYTAYPQAPKVEQIQRACDIFLGVKPSSEKIALEEELGENIAKRSQELRQYLRRAVSTRNVREDGINEVQYEEMMDDMHQDPNFIAFKEAEEQLLKKYYGQYIGLINGEVVFNDKDRNKVINFMIDNYPGKRKFVTLVTTEKVVEDIPSE